MTPTDKYKDLALYAKAARKKAYAPYSNISVGCAIITASGKIIEGANIENAAYSPTLCAERVALARAVMEGEVPVCVAISGGRIGEGAKDVFPPCGVCRQALTEFCRSDLPIVLATDEENYLTTLGELLPYGFSKENLK